MLHQLNFPEYTFQLKKKGDKTFIFDVIRKKWLLLTPEEWVRQHWVHHLVHEKGYPASLVGLEKNFRLNFLQKRFDILIGHPPLLLVECKAPGVKITQQAFDQVTRYNMAWNVPWLVVSNGLQHFVCNIDLQKGTLLFVDDLPVYGK